MKRTVLIPILLSTFLLVGCETETEFDRCFEANGGNAEFDLASFREKQNSMISVPEDTPYEDFVKVFSERVDMFESSMTAIESEFYLCGNEKYEQQMKKLEARGIDRSDITLEKMIDQDEIDNLCLPKNRAKAICHSQGIY